MSAFADIVGLSTTNAPVADFRDVLREDYDLSDSGIVSYLQLVYIYTESLFPAVCQNHFMPPSFEALPTFSYTSRSQSGMSRHGPRYIPQPFSMISWTSSPRLWMRTDGEVRCSFGPPRKAVSPMPILLASRAFWSLPFSMPGQRDSTHIILLPFRLSYSIFLSLSEGTESTSERRLGLWESPFFFDLPIGHPRKLALDEKCIFVPRALRRGSLGWDYLTLVKAVPGWC
jgi:hypothetical protein